ncbi:chaperonin Cpn60/TCP-1 family [Lanmaoa asiatica]|nr:chaperonin Cpn60/TCP-1 family [Lanmaoa asiatica]KAH0826022.1 chaperonin Cpn60/TCP-1 family [Lanmaoa asiatica]
MAFLLNKVITHPNMRRRIQHPRIVLLDCPLEYKRGESQTNTGFSKDSDWARVQEIEEEQVITQCKRVLEFEPDLVVTEKGVSGWSALAIARAAPYPRLVIDTAQHVFEHANVSAIRRVRKSDNSRIALAVGATIVNRVEDLRESDVGAGCGLFHIEKIGDEHVPLVPQSSPRLIILLRPRYFTFLTACTDPKACTVLLRGPSKDILNEIERNPANALSVARNVYLNPILVPGDGATEVAISIGLHAKARSVTGIEGWPYRAVADAMEVIPRTLVQDRGHEVIWLV